MNRFERPQQINPSKQALSMMLKQRQPLNQFMGPGAQNPVPPAPQATANYAPMQRQFPRQPMRHQHPAAMQSNQVSLLKTSEEILINKNMFRECFSNNTEICKVAWVNSTVIILVIQVV